MTRDLGNALRVRHTLIGCSVLLLGALTAGRDTWAADAATSPAADVIPHNQTAPPGPALTPAEAIAKMSVPTGFQVELVAGEPDVVNPVAMAIDERGRFWITESFEYPRREPGPGRDRIRVLEDTNQDGQVDKVTTFAEGLNIPSGIALGYGGVWVANSPDILFLQDTDGDGRADHQEVVVTGFGRDDTHELPNSLTWGPDGWLYGLNGVFNASHVRQGDRDFDFTCALFRIHPRTREFQLFCEGTSNPWGVAFDSEGSAFVSACVIDHLWHLSETGYYHRQGGPYPPYTWKLESIVKHKHQMAAYCGITYFDSDAYPAPYREKLYMGNIHGNCINVDHLTRSGATYIGHDDPDFLSANDAWFMPIVQKTGPDGCLYVLDWYDRYHCYQDANRDPQGIDRGRGRLYRIRYGNSPRADRFDLAQESDPQLIDRLRSPNIYFREQAQRLLAERNKVGTREALQVLLFDGQETRKTRLHALWTLISCGPLNEAFHLGLLSHSDATFRAFGVRAAGNQGRVSSAVVARLLELTRDDDPDVRLQVAVAANKVAANDAMTWLCRLLSDTHDDPIIPQIIWRNLLPHLERRSQDFIRHLQQARPTSPGWNALLPHAIERLATDPSQASVVGQLLAETVTANWPSSDECVHNVRSLYLQHPDWREPRTALHTALQPVIQRENGRGQQGRPAVILLATVLGDQASKQTALRWLSSRQDTPPDVRLAAYDTLTTLREPQALDAAADLLDHSDSFDVNLLSGIISSLGRLADPRVPQVILDHYAQSNAELKPRMIELLTQRDDWAEPLLAAVVAERLPKDALHINQIRRLQHAADPRVVQLVQRIWGQIREGRNPDVENAIAQVRQWVAQTPGDALRGQAVFKKTCAQCHQIYGEGERVGPDISRNGRSSFDQLLSNVFDPNLVIGADYQARLLVTADGRTLTGLLVEDSPDRVVLKLQGGKQETVPRADVDELTVSPLSLMPEGWEKQLPQQEVVDLLHFLTLDGPPQEPASKRIPGTPELK